MPAAIETPAFEVLDAPPCAVGESPLWCVEEQALWWVDIDGYRLYRHDYTSGRTRDWTTPERPASIALHCAGGLVTAMESGVFHLRPGPAGRIGSRLLAAASHKHSGMRFNDGRCDHDGRFWVSSMVHDMSLALADGVLHSLSIDAELRPRLAGLVTGNGLAFSPTGDRLYLSDSHPTVRRVWAFDLDPQGRLSGRREFIDMRVHPGRPDGAAVDAEGGYWICANDGGMVLRFTPDGVLDRQLRVPFAKPSMCAFGGPDLDQLHVTSIRPAVPVPGYDAALAGAVVRLYAGVAGLPEPAFGRRREP
ncbi:MAG: SMP-30/gluconolactonase/LRE family protein [Zoogloeaceae bacterium]|nr:SMP-30/gluconolactonase/LRE family protein [Zoogloeaceae bacterium]MCP5239367.1 SMP-30/gluconolactonase/LRE family protein [Zoogloeaceae bacterium]MCP5254865.1 SMP-30/gluconolactonase/LRE family protein [Zoogloeaceae bacterium]MCP5295574.1 SMP-30/gluconolactonase/LRE family protein [Zoogloeaceae bacterium]MCW5616735.1 SMP-30/gluconolactonase/LRE family protein [Rhodocyclaceae bacterium]